MELQKHIIDENNGLAYTLVGDYYLPDFALRAEEAFKEYDKEINSLGKYGRLRHDYLVRNKFPVYWMMLENGSLMEHLRQTDETANLILEQFIKAFSEADGCNEELKAKDQMKWVGLMNNYTHCAEEVIMPELIYD